MQHPDEGTIHAWLDGALSAEEAAHVEAHVKECPECEAAVAEARGFIAASSRILTALDDAPRGVIPAAPPRKRVDPLVWRIAATVLVVFAGTVLVVRNTSLGTTPSSAASSTSDSSRMPTMAPLVLSSSAADQSMAQTGAATGAQPPHAKSENAAPNVTGVPKSPAAVGAAAPRSPMVAAEKTQARSEVDAGDSRKPEAPAVTNQTVTQPVVGGVAGTVADAAQSGAGSAARRFEAMSRTQTAVTGVGSAADARPLRVVGTPRALGEKLTLYEVAPGDTVVLAEQLMLESVVVTSAQTEVRQTVPAPTARRGAAKTAAPPDTSAAAAAPPTARVAAPAPVVAPTSQPVFREGADGTNTLIWNDPKTGNQTRLSGRHTRAELEQIRERIERLKAATADSLKKAR